MLGNGMTEPGAAQEDTARTTGFVRGDATGLAIPAHEAALREAGASFLTEAFRAFGSLGTDNAVARIASVRRCLGGSTGAKLFLSIEYEKPDPALKTDLFVKFSRDFEDERRDNQGRWEMAPEVPFSRLTRQPGFPVAVPEALFADYEAKTGTGLVITECIGFGEGAIEPHRRKCLDHLTIDEPLSYYRQTVSALARLCAAHKSGALSSDIDDVFPFDPATGSADPIRYTREELAAELDYCIDFARARANLLPDAVRSEAFFETMRRDVWRVYENEAALQRCLTGNPDMVALCHWNAHIDNCWFWRDKGGELHCGLIDWGRVGQITFGSILWGGLSAAHNDIWDYHLDELLDLFVAEYRAHGGPAITADALLEHLTLHMATMGVARVLAFPEIVMFRLPDCAEASGPRDAMFEPVACDPARNCLHIYTVFLKFWQSRGFDWALDRLLGSV
jgi:hypothetical protein